MKCGICRLDIDDPQHMRRVHSSGWHIETLAALMENTDPIYLHAKVANVCPDTTDDEWMAARELYLKRKHHRAIHAQVYGNPSYGGRG